MFDVNLACQCLKYTFNNPTLCQMAFTHRSFTSESPSIDYDNEKLEFLGDAILGSVITAFIFEHCPDQKEGVCSQLKAFLVSATACREYAKKLKLENLLLLGKGEKKNQEGAFSRLADLFEAVVGAIFLDGGFEAAQGFIQTHFSKHLLENIEGFKPNPKMLLQEHLQQHQKMPRYQLLEEYKKEHRSYFVIGVFVEEKLIAKGEGFSKKEAEYEAANRACSILKT